MSVVKDKPVDKKYVKHKSAIEKDIQQSQPNIIQQSQTSDLIRAMEMLQSNDNIESNTILTNRQVNALSLMNWAGQVYDIDFFKHYVTLFPKYRISGDGGRGRKEIIQIAEALQKEKLQEHDRLLDFIGKR